MTPPLLSASHMMRRGYSTVRRRLKVRLTIMAALPVILCGIGGLAPVAPAQTLTDGIAAIVNADVIMMSDLRAAMADEIVRLQARYEEEDFKKRLAHKQHAVLNRMVERKLELQEAEAKSMTVTDEEVNAAWEQVPNNADTGPTARDRETLREEMTLRRLMEFEVQRRIIVPFEEIRAYYHEQESQFTTPPTYLLYQILLTPKPDESMAAVRARAEDLERRLREGALFTELATVYSEGPAKENGGDLGFVRKEDLLTPLGAALAELTEGERSPLIATDIGIHILRRGERREGTPQPFDDVKDFIENQLYQNKLRDGRDAWLSALKDKSYIDIRL